MPNRLAGKVAIVTGAGGGIGQEHALLFASEGAKIVVNDIGVGRVADDEAASADRVVEQIRAAGSEAVASHDSAATLAGAKAIVEQALEAYGRVDILINNATAVRSNDIWRFTEEEWDLTSDVNLKGYFAMIKYVAPHLCKQRDGVIVNTSSVSGFGHLSMTAYASAKEGVVGLTRSVAMELGRFGVRCNAIRPSAATYHAVKIYPERSQRWTALVGAAMERARGRQLVNARTPEEDAEAKAPRKVPPLVVWLCTDAAKNVTGKTFHVGEDFVGRYSEPELERSLYMRGGWTLDALDEVGAELIGDLTNPFVFDDHPEWQVFDE